MEHARVFLFEHENCTCIPRAQPEHARVFHLYLGLLNVARAQRYQVAKPRHLPANITKQV